MRLFSAAPSCAVWLHPGLSREFLRGQAFLVRAMDSELPEVDQESLDEGHADVEPRASSQKVRGSALNAVLTSRRSA